MRPAKEPVIFIDQDTPVEYDLIRAICTVTQQKREKLGILTTDAQLYGGINFQTMGTQPELADRRRAVEAV